MFAVECASGGRRWISAVVAQRRDAEAQMQSAPVGLRAEQQLVDVPLDAFPVFIIEKQNHFEFCDLKTVAERLVALEPGGDGDHFHFNVYALRGPYIPIKPGRDEMGRMRHWHVGDRELCSPGREALLAELA